MERLQIVSDITDPAELAMTRADVIVGNPDLTDSEEERRVLRELDAISEALGFSERHYFIEASQSFFLPRDYSEENQNVCRFEDKFAFCGTLKTFGIVKIGRLAVADHSVRSLCLVFYSFTFLETAGTVEEADEHMLCTPAYAVEDIAAGDWL